MTSPDATPADSTPSDGPDAGMPDAAEPATEDALDPAVEAELDRREEEADVRNGEGDPEGPSAGADPTPGSASDIGAGAD